MVKEKKKQTNKTKQVIPKEVPLKLSGKIINMALEIYIPVIIKMLLHIYFGGLSRQTSGFR